MHKALPKNVYRVSLAILFGQLVFAISVVAADVLHSRYGILADVDWPLFTWPLGLWAGWRFTNRSLAWHRFHIFCVIAGGVLTPIVVALAVRFHLEAEALKGTGFLAGLGEAITAYVCVFLGIGTLLLFVAGSTTTFNGWRFSLRTLLIAMTLIAVTLELIVYASR